jgi:hypothetical protein
MNCDILMMIYNNILSADGNRRHKPIITNFGTHSNLYERFARIMAV